jgi:Flp pilus assembly protein TadG
MSSSLPRRRPSRRGNVLVLTAFGLVMIFSMVAFAIDIGYILHVNTELQRTADACAMAAVQRLPDQSDAVAAAQAVAEQNKGMEGPVLGLSDIVFGKWDRDTATFSPTTDGPNAVRVVVERTSARGNPLGLFFAPLIGSSYSDVSASATSMYDNNLCGPLIGIEWVQVPGEPTTDSFRSSDGSYASQVPRDNGNLCSDGPIGLEGSPIANGDANAGRGYGTTLEGSAQVTGNMSPRLRGLNLPDVDASQYEFNNDNSGLPGVKKGKSYVSPVDGKGNFLLDGGAEYDMPPGTYYLNNLTMTGQSTLRTSGPTDIYLTGNLDTAGGFLINDTQIASNLRIFMQGGSSSTAIVTSSVDLYSVVYAPKTAVETRGSGQLYGAVVGRTLYVTGTGDAHYDEDLKLDDRLKLPKRVALVE